MEAIRARYRRTADDQDLGIMTLRRDGDDLWVTSGKKGVPKRGWVEGSSNAEEKRDAIHKGMDKKPPKKKNGFLTFWKKAPWR